MSKNILLSAELSRGRALLAGGAPSQKVLDSFRQWMFRAPTRGSRRITESLVHWNESLCSAIRDALPLGTPIGKLLASIQPMIRREERHWVKLQGIERQFAFQGAIAVVLPWAVAALSGGIQFNFFTFAGVIFQLLGLGLFYFIIRRATRREQDECAWIFDFLISIWMRVLAGMTLYSSLKAALDCSAIGSKYSDSWKTWLQAYDGGASEILSFDWPPSMGMSRETGQLILALLKNGAPAGSTLEDSISQLDDERQSILEDRLAAVPTRLSLAFCAFFTPAVFLILMGALWPTLRNISI